MNYTNSWNYIHDSGNEVSSKYVALSSPLSKNLKIKICKKSIQFYPPY
jgi:hypothetical protein